MSVLLGQDGQDVPAPKSRVRDLKDREFGELTVVSRAENSKAGKARWNCKCSCGGEKTVVGSDLISGKITTCGDRKKHRPVSQVQDVVGEEHGGSVIVRELEPHVCPDGQKQRRVVCRCPHGHEFEYGLAALRSERCPEVACKECRDEERHRKAREEQQSMIGMKFGRLTVMSIAPDYVIPSTGYRHQMFNCLCECKNWTVTGRRDLESGKSKSCGCLKAERASEAALDDLSGREFGLLTVIGRVEDTVTAGGNRKATYLCHCAGCDSLIEVTGGELRNGQKSCGCAKGLFVSESKIKDLTDMRFGKLVAKSMTGEQTSGGNMLWWCVCDCKNVCVVNSRALLSGNTGSCGCALLSTSKLELYVTQYFDGCKPGAFDHYESQVRFDDLRGVSGGKLSYDFGLYDADGNLNCLIECQGVQHYKPVDRFGGDMKFEVQQFHDGLKREYAANHGIKLIELPYTLQTYDKTVECLKNEGIV